MKYLERIHEGNKLTLNKPVNSDRIYYSELQQWFTNNAFRSFSIKYVVQGTIFYRCKNEQYRVDQDHFLLAPKQPDVSACFESRQPVKSICIDICPSSIEEAYTILHSGGKIDLDNYLDGYFEHPHFFEHVYHVRESAFGVRLQKLAHALTSGYSPQHDINEEWFLQLVEQVVLQEKENLEALTGIEARKYSTRKEIYQRVLKGKQYMDSFYATNPTIETVARQCNLSTFHFFRSFRQAFGISPYQYMMQLRLKYAVSLMQEEQHTFTDIAAICGFPDVFTFSKAFKRAYGLSPLKYCLFHLKNYPFHR